VTVRGFFVDMSSSINEVEDARSRLVVAEFPEQFLVFLQWDEVRSEGSSEICHHLGVDEGDSCRLHGFDGLAECDFRGARLAEEHAFAAKDLAYDHAVESSHEVAVLVEGLEAVGVSHPVELLEGAKHLWSNPGAFAVRALDGSAGLDYIIETHVSRYFEPLLLQFALKAFWDVELVYWNDTAHLRHGPKDGPLIVRPREDSMVIGVNEHLAVNVVSKTQDAVVVACFRWWKDARPHIRRRSC